MNNAAFGFQGGGGSATPLPPTSATQTFSVANGGLVNGGNTVTLGSTPTAITMVFWDGVTTVPTTQWTLAGNVITFVSDVFNPTTVIQVIYQF